MMNRRQFTLGATAGVVSVAATGFKLSAFAAGTPTPDAPSIDALGELREEVWGGSWGSRWRAGGWNAGKTGSLMARVLLTGRRGNSAFGRSDLLMDLRWSFRSIRKNPLFALGVIAVLGVGPGATAAACPAVE